MMNFFCEFFFFVFSFFEYLVVCFGSKKRCKDDFLTRLE